MDSLYKKILSRLIINGGEVLVDIAEIMTNLIDASTIGEYENVKSKLLYLVENKLGLHLYKVEVKTKTKI
jgi:hypothetical protein